MRKWHVSDQERKNKPQSGLRKQGRAPITETNIMRPVDKNCFRFFQHYGPFSPVDPTSHMPQSKPAVIRTVAEVQFVGALCRSVLQRPGFLECLTLIAYVKDCDTG